MMNSKNTQLLFRPVYASVKSCTLIALAIVILLFGSMSVTIADYIVSGTETYDSSKMTGTVTLSNGATLNCSGQTIDSSVTTSIVVASGSTATINGGGSGKVQAPISLDGTINLNALSQVTGNITGNGKVSVSDGGSTRVSLSGTNSYKGGMATDSWNGNISIYGDQSQATGGYAISSTTLNKCAEVYLKSGAKATGPLQVRGNVGYASFLNIESGASYTITDSSQGVLLQQSTNGGYGRPGAWVYLSGTMSNAGTLTMANAAGVDVRNGGKWTQNGKITMTNNQYHGITFNVQSGGSFTYTGTDPITINPHSSTTTAAATTNINIAGTFETSAGFKVGVNSISGTSRATINLNGGTIKAGADIDNLITGVNTGSVATLPNLKVNSASTIDTNGHNITINTYGNSGVFSGSAQLTKKGSGTLTFSGANSYTGVVDVQAGTLEIANGAKLAANSDGIITVNSGTTLKYTDSVPGNTSALTYQMNGGTLEFYNSTFTSVGHGAANAICSGASNQGVTIQGTGTLKITNNNGTGTVAALNGGSSTFKVALDSNSLIDIQGTFVEGGYTAQDWSSNYAAMNLGSKAVLDVWDGKKIQVSSLSGDEGALIQVASATGQVGSDTNKGINIGVGVTDSTLSATYNGTINCNYCPRITKYGKGTQIFNGDITYIQSYCTDGVLEFNGNLNRTNNTAQGGTFKFNGDSINDTTISAQGGTVIMGSAGKDMTVTVNTAGWTYLYQTSGTFQVDGNLVVDCDGQYVYGGGTWTGNGTLTVKKGYFALKSNLVFTSGKIVLDGGILHNNGASRSYTVPITVQSDSYIKAGWSSELIIYGSITGTKNITILGDSGIVKFEGSGSSDYTGSLILNSTTSRVRVGKNDQATQVNGTDYIGTGKIIMQGGLLMNNNNVLAINNDIYFQSTGYLQSGWSRDTTYTGTISGSGRIEVNSDSGTIIFQTKSTDTDPFTGEVQFNYGSSSSYGKGKLAIDNAFGNQAGTLRLFGTLDMSGYSQKFKGMLSDGSKGNLYNTNSSKTSTITLDLQNGNTYNYYGVIQNNIDLIVDGNGTEVFNNGNSSFTGNITVNGGVLKSTPQYSGDNSPFGYFKTSSRTITVNAGGELYMGNCNTFGGCVTADNYYDNFINIVVNGGKITSSLNNVLYAATLQNGAELYGTNPEATWKSFWLKGETKVSFAGDGTTAEKAVTFNGASDAVTFVPYKTTFNVDDITKGEEADLVVNVPFADGPTYNGVLYAASFTKTGTGTMLLTADSTYTGGTTISDGIIKLTGDGTLGTGKVTNSATLEFSPIVNEAMTISNEIAGGNLLKTGAGVLYLNGTDTKPISSAKFDVEEGTLMFKGRYSGNLTVGNGTDSAILSPGNSVGTLSVAGALGVNSNGTLWFEQDSTGMDQLILETGTTLSIDKDAILELTMGEAISGATYLIVDSADQFKGDYASDSYWNSLLSPGSNYFWNLSVVDGNKVFAQIDPNAVPEPSTWALLILGFAGLMWLRRKK